MKSTSFFETPEESNSKFIAKVKESPFMIMGIGGFVAAGVIGAYKFRHRGSMSPSVFLMQLRVAAQGTVVGCLTLGLGYTMAREYLFSDKKKDS